MSDSLHFVTDVDPVMRELVRAALRAGGEGRSIGSTRPGAAAQPEPGRAVEGGLDEGDPVGALRRPA